MALLFCDIETFSGTDIKAGTYRYCQDPLFEILMCGYSWAGSEQVHMLVGEAEIVPWLTDALNDPETILVVHHANFERICFSTVLGELLPPERFICTMALAAAAGYPQSLEKLAKALGVTEKDTAGTRLINMFCKPQRGRRIWPHDKPEQWQQFIDYCRQDVEVLIEAFDKLPPLTEMERRVYDTDQRINDRGVALDMEFAKAAVSIATANAADQLEELRHLTGLDNPNSVTQLKAWLHGTGLQIPNLQEGTVSNYLLKPNLKPVHREVLELRQELALTASKKYTAAVESVCLDGRFRGGFKFHGAHTGRWTGRGIQPHNFPRESFHEGDEYDFEAEALVRRNVLAGVGATPVELKKSVRPMLLGPFGVVDYEAIEARVIAWLADESWAIEAFEAKRDIYVETAQRMGGLTRAQGKIAVLALGFNGGIMSLRKMGAQGDDAELQRMVYQWRDANPRIVRLWKQMDSRFRTGGRVGRLVIEKDGTDRLMRLPSGRALVYHKVSTSGDRITFADPKGYRGDTYGGRLIENATQAVARDILAESLVRLEAHGYQTVLHVHDEIVCETDDIDGMVKVMCEPPSWADGLPIAAKGFATSRYRKD